MRKSSHKWLAAVALAVSSGMVACTDDPRVTPEGVGAAGARRGGAGEHAGSEGRGEDSGSEGAGEHARPEGSGEHREGGEHAEHGSEAEGEESGEHIDLEETWDATRSGLRLVLVFDRESSAFVGTVENTIGRTRCDVRVEVHLSTGTELGPTEQLDLLSGAKTMVRLPTTGEAFDTWTAHPEVSACTDR